jgi:hypothetical protein
MKRPSRWLFPFALTILSSFAIPPASAQTGAKNGEWTTYGGDLASTRYAPLDQINEIGRASCRERVSTLV